MQAYHRHPPSLRRHNSHVNCAADGDKASGVGIMGEFNPTDVEIIREYLMKKISNEAFHTDMISPVQFYAFTPDYLSEMYRASGDRVWYYFTRRRRKYRRGHVVDRTAAGGYWDIVTAHKDIMHNRRVIGSHKLFAYFTGKRRDSVRTGWMMREFTAPENRARMGDWVVCEMYKNTSKRGGCSLIHDVVNETGSSRKRNRVGEVNNNPAYTEAIRPVDDSSTAIASPNFECFKQWKNFKVNCNEMGTYSDKF